MSHRTLFSRVGPLLLIGALVVVFFQNCTSDRASTRDGSSGQGLEFSGNGTGYGGKVVVSPVADSSLCPDLTNIHQRVEIKDSKATLVRDNCADLPVSEHKDLGSVSPFSGSTVQVAGKAYQLESLMGDGRGQMAKNLMGEYAPSMVSDVLPSASFVDGVALGPNHILVAYTQQAPNLTVIGQEVMLRLYRREGVNLELKKEIAVPVPTVMALSDLRVLMGSFPIDETHAVVVTHRTNPFGTQALLLKRTADDIELVDSTSVLGDILHIQGYPLDGGRYLMTYVPNRLGALKNLAARVVSVSENKLVLGTPAVVYNPAPQPSGPVSVLQVPNMPDRFEAYSSNTNYNYLSGPNEGLATGVGNLVHFSLKVEGMTVTALGPAVMEGSTTELTCCSLDFVGDAANSLMTLTTKDAGHAWTKFLSGVAAALNNLSPAKGYFTGPMNMMGPQNLHLNGRYYFRVPTATGTRIFYLDSLDGPEQLYDTTFPRSRDHNTSKLFASGDNLVLIESDMLTFDTAKDGHIRVLSTPTKP